MVCCANIRGGDCYTFPWSQNEVKGAKVAVSKWLIIFHFELCPHTWTNGRIREIDRSTFEKHLRIFVWINKCICTSGDCMIYIFRQTHSTYAHTMYYAHSLTNACVHTCACANKPVLKWRWTVTLWLWIQSIWLKGQRQQCAASGDREKQDSHTLTLPTVNIYLHSELV